MIQPEPLSNRRFGNLVEAMFQVRALEMGIVIGRPLGEPDDFDFFASIGPAKPVKVQIKGARIGSRGCFSFQLGSLTRVTSRRSFDFLVLVTVPDPAQWYVIPKSEIVGFQSLKIWPGRKSRAAGRWDAFRDRWDLFAQV